MSHNVACLLQGLASHSNIKICSNLLNKAVASRGISTPNIEKIPINLACHYIGDEDAVIIDETREAGHVHADIKFYEQVSRIAQKQPVSIFCMTDTANVTEFPQNASLYITHSHKSASKNPHAIPVGFFISDEIIDKSTEALKANTVRKPLIINNFNITLNQSVRASLELSLVPELEKIAQVERRNTNECEYLRQLTESAAILAYGGHYYQSPLTYEHLRVKYQNDQFFTSTHLFPDIGKKAVIFRWDSWRFWEGLLFECPPLQLDFDEYGFALPDTPKAWSQYIPISLKNIESLAHKLANDNHLNLDVLEMIGKTGREWAIEKYSPKKMAALYLKSFE